MKIDYKNAAKNRRISDSKTSLFEQVSPSDIGINFQQKENNFNDFKKQILLPQKQSEMSSPLVVGDVNII